jgi:hypothetical protein
MTQLVEINTGKCQSCPFSPALFNMYIKIFSEWDRKYTRDTIEKELRIKNTSLCR